MCNHSDTSGEQTEPLLLDSPVALLTACVWTIIVSCFPVPTPTRTRLSVMRASGIRNQGHNWECSLWSSRQLNAISPTTVLQTDWGIGRGEACNESLENYYTLFMGSARLFTILATCFDGWWTANEKRYCFFGILLYHLQVLPYVATLSIKTY